MEVFITFIKTYVFQFEKDAENIHFLIRKKLSLFEKIHEDRFVLSIDGNIVPFSDENIDRFNRNDNFLIIRATLTNELCGGKGGYGSLLRRAAKQSGPKKTTDFGACRDLSGRRIRHVNDEIILKKWQEAKERNQEFNPDEPTPSGINLWYLPTPSWSADFGKNMKNQRKKMKKKTELCKDWLESHEYGRYIPPDATIHWGCPRGSRCDYAHGENDMEKNAYIEYQKVKQIEIKEENHNKLNEYLSAVYEEDNDDMGDIVLSGLKKVMKRKRLTITADSSKTEDLNSNLIIENEDDQKASKYIHHSSEQLEDNDVYLDPSEISSCECKWLRILTGDCEILEDGTILGRQEFSTICLNQSLCHGSGTWYYETRILTDGLIQIGWCCGDFSPDAMNGNGVGDDNYSWSYDGYRSKKWHLNHEPYGIPESDDATKPIENEDENENITSTPHNEGTHELNSEYEDTKLVSSWKKDDIVGSQLRIVSINEQMYEVNMTFFINGRSLGTAFGFTFYKSDEQFIKGFCPAISVETNQSVKMNIGYEKFIYPPKDLFQSLADLRLQVKLNQDHLETELKHEIEDIPKQTVYISTNKADSNDSNDSIDFNTYILIDLNSDDYKIYENIEKLGNERLKVELMKRGLKCGGTLQERAKRLYSIRGLRDDEIPMKLKAKK